MVSPRSDLRVDAFIVDDNHMPYIVQRKDRFYVVDYDGLEPSRAGSHPVEGAQGTTKAQVADLGLHVVAGAGFEPGTFGL